MPYVFIHEWDGESKSYRGETCRGWHIQITFPKLQFHDAHARKYFRFKYFNNGLDVETHDDMIGRWVYVDELIPAVHFATHALVMPADFELTRLKAMIGGENED